MKCSSGIALLIAIVLPLITLISSLMIPVDIQAATNTTEILVNISEVAQITVSPDHMQWLQVAPGSNGSEQRITVENVGSTIFSSGIYVSVDSYQNTTNNPTANDEVTKYMAGTFLVMANTTHYGNNNFYFVNQISWNESAYPSPTSPGSSANISWGYFHNTSQKWLWQLKNGTNDGSVGECLSGSTLSIVQTEGSTDLGSVYNADFLTNDSTWAVFGFADGALEGYCVASHRTCEYIMIYKFDRNESLPGYDVCNISYIGAGTFIPSQKKYFEAKPNIPSGIPAGTVSNSTVTFTAA